MIYKNKVDKKSNGMNCSEISGECDFSKGLTCLGVDGTKECG